MPLDLPEPDSTKLPGSPLELVVCQVRFDSRASVSEGPTALVVYEALGGSDGEFPVLHEVEGFNVTVAPGQVPSAEARTSTGWRMESDNGSWVVSLMPDHAALETTAYTTWEEFQPRLAKLVDATAEHVQPTFEQRLGLRYVDRIRELELATAPEWEPFIAKELLGLAGHPKLGAAVKTAQQQILLEVEEGVQCLLRQGLIADEQRGVTDYVLDYDLHRALSRPFDAGSIKEAAETFNRAALQLFQASILPELMQRFRRA